MKSFMVFIISLFLFVATAHAKVDYTEILSIGTSTTPAAGSSTVLADTTRGYDRYKYFEAHIQYQNLQTTVPMRYTLSTANPSATTGFTIKDGDTLILRSLSDMQNFKACAGTTTAGSYGTAAVHYIPLQQDGVSPAVIYDQ